MQVELKWYTSNYKDIIIDLTQKWYPETKSEKLSSTEYKRLIRKFVRQRDSILKTCVVYFTISCPLFVHQDLRCKSKNFQNYAPNLDIDNLSFDVDDKFTDPQKSYLSCIIKKIKKLELAEEQLIYFLPSCVLSECYIVFDFLELFEFFEMMSNYKCHPKILELSENMYNIILDVIPDIYSKQNLDIFLASKES